MEYMERGNLSVLIESARRHEFQIPFNLLVRILLQVANGVAFLHKIGADKQIVHGDLKPSNVVLKDDFTAKVTDFGGASLRTYTGKSCFPQDKTAATEVLPSAQNQQHTLVYTAPERLQHPEFAATKSSDVYSFGMTIYECLTDLVPFSGAVHDKDTLIKAIVDRMIKPPRERIEQKKEHYDGEQHESLLCLEKHMESSWQYKKRDRPELITIRNQLQTHFDKVARKHIWNSIAEVSSRLGSCTQTPAPSSQVIPLKYLCPPYFRPSHVPNELLLKGLHIYKPVAELQQKQDVNPRKRPIEKPKDLERKRSRTPVQQHPTDKYLLEDTILPLIRRTADKVNNEDPKVLEAAFFALNVALEAEGKLCSDDYARLVFEINALCEKVDQPDSPGYRELMFHGLNKCLGINDKDVQAGYHKSLLAKIRKIVALV
ncbi:uncharacterized protein LOC108950991 [Ciona intestinalis]